MLKAQHTHDLAAKLDTASMKPLWSSSAFHSTGLLSAQGGWGGFQGKPETERTAHLEAAIWHTAEDGENTFIFMDLLRLGILEVIK